MRAIDTRIHNVSIQGCTRVELNIKICILSRSYIAKRSFRGTMKWTATMAVGSTPTIDHANQLSKFIMISAGSNIELAISKYTSILGAHPCHCNTLADLTGAKTLHLHPWTTMMVTAGASWDLRQLLQQLLAEVLRDAGSRSTNKRRRILVLELVQRSKNLCPTQSSN